MRLLNKIAVGASAFALAAALSAGVNTASADAAAAPITGTFDLGKSQAIITATGDKKVVVSYPTVDKKGVLSADKNVCTYDVDDASGKVVVDLSTLNPTKDNYIKISGNVNTEPVVYKIPAALQLGKGTAASSGAITVTKKDKSALSANETASLEYATTSSNWIPSLDMNFSKYLQLGATIRVRATGRNNAPVKETKTIKDKNNEYALTVLDGTLPGKEIKVKIAKMANAPKAKVDYAKRTITVPAKSQYRINTANGLGDWVDSASKTVLDKTKLDFTVNNAIDVRTKATDKKPASKYAAVSWKAIYKIGVKVDATNAKKASLVVSGTSTTVTGGAVNVEYAVTNSVMNGTKVKTATSAAVTIDNKASGALYSYQYVIVDKGTEVKLDTKGVKTLKAGKDVKITVKDSKTYKDKDIYVRRAAVTKGNTQWVTDWVKVATITEKAGKVTLG